MVNESGEQAVVRVEVRNLQTVTVPEQVLVAAAREALALAGETLDSLGVALVDAERMARLNREFLERSGPTDVIAFPAEQTEEGRSGEVIVCVSVAEEQAQEQGHSLLRELAVLVAHGTLHTVGHRDDTETGRQVMADLQERAATRALAP